MHRWFAFVLALVFAGCTSVSPTPAFAADDSPPLIAGRVSFLEGDSRIWRVEEDAAGQWDATAVNDVVSPGTGLYTGNDGRNEIRVGPHTFRLGASSRGGFSQLDYTGAVFNVEYGTLNVRLSRPENGERIEVTASGARLELTGPGRYRVDVTENGPVRLTVFEGHATARGPSNALGVSAGQAIIVDPSSAGFNFEQPITTALDQWASARDDNFSHVRSAQYVSPYMTGYEELDNAGDWVPDVTYGTVWVPRVVPVGWAPYRYGQWRWVRPWGWTWVDNAPWGYAPFHYGRWVYVGSRWCWWPGGYVRRPVWGPAFVGFVGSSAGDRIWGGVRGPLVGWYPLAPWNRYEPSYRHSPTYVTVINQTIINRPPAGVPPTVNHGPGATMVPGPRFREPVTKVALIERPRIEELKPTPPPAKDIAPAPRATSPKFAEQSGRVPDARATPAPRPSAPPQASSPPTRVMPPIVAEPVPGRGVPPQPALPGNNPEPLAQPPKFKQVQPHPEVATPRPAPPVGERPRARTPSELEPQSTPRPVNPAEPARIPPGAPPTVRPPTMAPGARPVQPSPQPVPAPAVVARPTPPPAGQPQAAAPVPPAAHPAPTPKEQAMRQAAQERGDKGGGNDGPGRGKPQ